MGEAEVVISGIGLVLPGIASPATLWAHVGAGRCVLSARMASPHVDGDLPFGQVDEATQAEARALLPRRLARFASAGAQLGPLAVQRALHSAGLALDAITPSRRSLFSVEGDYAAAFESCAGAIAWTAAQERRTEADLVHACVAKRKLDVMGVVKSSWNNTLLVGSIHWQARATGGAFFCGPEGVVAALRQGRQALREDRCDVAIVNTTNAYLDPFLLAELLAAGWLAPGLRHPDGRLQSCCFDADSRGMVLSNGSAALVLEPAEAAARRGVQGLRLVQMTSAATLLDETVPDLPASSARCVIAQGSGLPAHDAHEARCILAHAPRAEAVTSVRSLLGSSGSTGLVADLALAQQALAHGRLPGMAAAQARVGPALPWVAPQGAPLPGRQVMVCARDWLGHWGAITVEPAA